MLGYFGTVEEFPFLQKIKMRSVALREKGAPAPWEEYFMKKALWMVLASLMLFSVACGKKADTKGSQAAQTEPSSEALSENSLSATVQKLENNKLTVETGEGKVMNFDVKGAKLDKNWELKPGDEVEISYEGTEPQDGMAIKGVTVSVPYEFTTEEFNDEQNFYGEITAVNDSSISVKEIPDFREAALEGEDTEGKKYGDTITFQRPSFEIDLTKGGLKVGSEVSVYYLGDLHNNPLAFYMITEDSMDDESADTLRVKGTIEKIDGEVFTLKGDDQHSFRFTTDGNDALTKEVEANKGKTVEVSYSTSLKARVSLAESIKAVQ